MPPPRDINPADPTLVKPTPGGEPGATPSPTDATAAHPPPPPGPAEQTFTAPPPVLFDAHTLLPAPPNERDETLIPSPDRVPTLLPPSEHNATMDWAGAAPPNPGGTMNAPTAMPASARVVTTPTPGGRVVGRFAIRGLHAKGGLGEVYTARDNELNREVALKQIQARFADDPHSRRRFLSEAEITARLDHPGVVPVFGLVADGNGRPCYAMRFIRGESLKDEIDRYHQKSESRGQKSDPKAVTGAPKSVEFRQLLQRFIAVCQAIAYAHTRGVIHRDIKPHNVMVGTFGETLVVDWGLAKVVGDTTPERPSGAIKNPTRDSEATEELTTMGSALGTPAYMPPEQAAGRVDQFGPRSDIYSLGATLYCLLTGKAPFSGKTTEEVVGKVKQGVFPRPRDVNPDTPKPLEAIALKAMALRQEHRYPDALALAADVERWLSDEPVRCYRDPITARIGRWARRHPARVAATVSLLITGFVGVAAGLWLVNEERKNTDRERQVAVDARNDEEKARNAALAAFKSEEEARVAAQAAYKSETIAKQQVMEARDAAAKRSHLALNAFGIIVQEVQDQLEDRAGTQALRHDLLRRAQAGLRELLDTTAGDKLPADHTCFVAFARMGDLRLALGDTREARTEYERAVGIAREVVRDRPSDIEGRRDLGAGLAKLAEAHLLTGNSTAARTASDESLRVRTEVLTADKGRTARRELAAGHRLAASVHLELGNTAAAQRECDAAAKLQQTIVDNAEEMFRQRWLLGDEERKLLGDLRRELADSRDQQADILLRVGDSGSAVEYAIPNLELRDAVLAVRDRTDTRRELADAYDRAGEVLMEYGHPATALNFFRDSRRILEETLAKDPRSAGARADLAVARGRIGFTLLRLGKRAEALKETQESVDLCRQLAAEDPESAKALRDLSQAYERHGDALLEDEKPAEALAEYRRSEAILRELALKDPESGRRREELGRVLVRIGDARLANGEVRLALEAMMRSLEHRQAIAAADPASARAKRLLFQTWERLFSAHRAAGNTALARSAAYRALEIATALAATEPDSEPVKRDLAVAHGKWGLALSDAGERFVPLIAWHKALDTYAELARQPGFTGIEMEDEANAAAWLAEVYTTARHFEPAVAAAGRSISIRKQVVRQYGQGDWLPHRNLMRGYRRLGDVYAQWLMLADADRCYLSALDVAKAFPEPELLAKEVAAVVRQKQVCDAINAGLSRADVSAYSPEIRAAALLVVLDVRLQTGHTVDAAAAADGLVKVARGADDVYHAARAYAVCAATAKTESQRTVYAAQAVKYLERAVRDGFRDAGQLAAGPWEAVRIDPAFGELAEKVRKLPPIAPAPHAVEKKG